MYEGVSQTPTLGAYTGANGTFVVSRRNGALYAQWNGASLPEYLEPIGPRSYFVPQDSSTITVAGSKRLERRWGTESPVVFELK